LIEQKEIKRDCRHFVGYIPCKPHKEFGYHCDDCPVYDPIKEKILIIKLGAIGDVIRTTPLLHRIWEKFPQAEIWWLTYSPEVLPSKIDHVVEYSLENLTLLQAIDFDVVINLDKDPHACALTKLLHSQEKLGFILRSGKPLNINGNSKDKFLTGIFDDVNQQNTKNYLEEIFEICGWQYRGEEYILECDKGVEWDIPSMGKKIIGLNTGCGARWVSRLLPDEQWENLIVLLNENGYFPMLLGGEQEHEKNLEFSKRMGVFYPGTFSLQGFMSLMDQCDLIVTGVTMALHIAIGLKKKVVLMNNIFNPNEFELFGRGEIVKPDKECKCFFRQKCINEEYNCMEHLPAGKLFEAIKRHV
jgi:ADP-heptose:LPS heptosyltransferase